MFIDEVEIYVRAGKGGDGAVSFRHEKYIPNGGPDGGDGGRGGNVLFEVDDRVHTLSDFARKKRFMAQNGQNGMGRNRAGKKGEDLILKVPTGTLIYHKGELMYDLTQKGEQIVLLKGGNGGWGNQHFATSIKQAPEWAKEGQKGESLKLDLVLKTIADVGLVGLPNAGKSTLLSVLTSARPKIADYPFTTLEPNLGTYVDRDSRIIIADIPGLIEGASGGKGLGCTFLKHIERTKIIVHLIDASSPDSVAGYKMIRNELKKFSKELSKKPEIIAINKIELISDDKKEEIKSAFGRIRKKTILISASTHQNIDKLINEIKSKIC
ncbi:MAG: GTPase ObgE [Patescibacteria group bacterium]